MRHVMVVDDDAMLREIFTRKLTRAGYNVTTAIDGAEALKELEIKHPDLIVLDMNMPNVGGDEVLKIVKEDENMKNIRVVIATAATIWRHHPEVANADALLFKPISTRELLETVKNLIGEP